MEIKELFTKTNSALNDIVQQVQPDQLDLIMPKYASYSDGQTMRTHLNICAYENACVPRMLAGERVPTNQENTEDFLKNDYKANFTALTEAANRVVLASSEEELDKTVHMSYADAPARSYLSDIVLQRSTAAIDIAQTAGISFEWPEELVQAIWNIAKPLAPTLREYGVFPTENPVDDDAPLQEKLIGLMGR